MDGTDDGPGERDVRSAARFLWWLVVRQVGRVALGALLGTLWMTGLAVSPYLLSRVIDDGLRSGRLPALLDRVGVLLAVGVLDAVVGILRHRTMTKVRMDGAFRTGHAVVVHCTVLGAALTRRSTAGEVVTIGMSDVWAIGVGLTVLGPGLGAVVACAVVAVVLLSISPLLAAVVLLGAPALVVLVGPVLGRLSAEGTAYRTWQGELTTRLVDVVTGLRVLGGIGGAGAVAQRYRLGSDRLRAQGYRVAAVSSWVPALSVGVPAVFVGVVTWLAARIAAAGGLSVGELVAVHGYVAVLVVPVTELIWSGGAVGQALVAARRVSAFLRIPPDHESGTASGVALPSGGLHDPASGTVVADGRLTALAGARPGDAVAIVDRLGRFRPSAATWGGVPLHDLPLDQVRAAVLVADHQADLFAGPLREVVAGRSEPDDDAVRRALHAAAADDVVRGLPDGLSAMLAPQGRNLSGGQRQRIRLARAVLADPEVLLAVEPTSAVDAHTEAAIAARLRLARAERTTLVATTSPLLLAQADVVHHVVDGRVRATGTHETLLHDPGYRRLVSRATGETADDPAAPDPATPPGPPR